MALGKILILGQLGRFCTQQPDDSTQLLLDRPAPTALLADLIPSVDSPTADVRPPKQGEGELKPDVAPHATESETCARGIRWERVSREAGWAK